MKRTMYLIINISLVLLIGISIFIQPKKSNVLSNSISKSIDTKIFIEVEKKKQEEKKRQEEKKKQEEEKAAQKRIEEVAKIDNEILQNAAVPNVDSNILETQVGPMSAYGPDCVGCSGYLAAGFNAKASIVYQDPTYGAVRIVAGDKKYPFGTIVRVSGSKLGTFNAIVLDRGGAIGIGKRFMFDLLCHTESEASGVGTAYNVKFEVLRYGY